MLLFDLINGAKDRISRVSNYLRSNTTGGVSYFINLLALGAAWLLFPIESPVFQRLKRGKDFYFPQINFHRTIRLPMQYELIED